MKLRKRVALSVLLLATTAAPVCAQVLPAEPARGMSTSDALAADIVVTATKRAGGEAAQDVPIAITAYGAPQLEAKFFRSLTDISATAPNVQLSTGGTIAGFANFAIRGLGPNSTIPSIEPTVGTFIDGIYIGVPGGIVLDNFDIEAVEVLRGPQGLLFGRNVTGGAVVIRTTRPSFTTTGNFRASVETGLNKTISGMISGPIVGDIVAAKLAVYYNDDDGYFTNEFNNNHDYGKTEQYIIRPAIRIEPNDGFSMDIRYEHGRSSGDGSAFQNQLLFKPDSFRVSNNEEGFQRQTWDQASMEFNVTTGIGTFTSVSGYRNYRADNSVDIDGTPNTFFHFGSRANHRGISTRQDQLSTELRLSGEVGPIEYTLGGFYFTQDLLLVEERVLAGGGIIQTGGGTQETTSYATFLSIDWHIFDQFTINLGGRYTWEHKSADVAQIRVGGCDITTLRCNNTFADSDSWRAFTPKIGLQWEPSDDTQAYTFFTRGFRGGGYNVRHTSSVVPPGPFDQEKQDSYEIGFKHNFGGGTRINAAAFYSEIKGMQREVIFPGGASVVQVIRNTADAEIKGVEAEGQFVVARGLVLNGQVGYVHGEYTKVLFDISGDGIINDIDLKLKIPKLRPWSYGAGVSYDFSLGMLGQLTARANINHFDDTFHADNNSTVSPGGNFLDTSLTLAMDNGIRLSVYGKNLLDEATFGQMAPFPASFGGAGSMAGTISKGRIIGAEIQYKF